MQKKREFPIPEHWDSEGNHYPSSVITQWAKPGPTDPLSIGRFFTFTFRVEHWKKSTWVLFLETLPYILRNLARIDIEFRLVPELTSSGILHYHMLICSNSPTKLTLLGHFRHSWLKKYGNTDEKMGGIFGYFIYMRKSCEVMSAIFGFPNPMHLIITKSTSVSILHQIRHLLYLARKRTAGLQTLDKVIEYITSGPKRKKRSVDLVRAEALPLSTVMADLDYMPPGIYHTISVMKLVKTI